MRPSRNTILGLGAVALVAIAAVGLAMAQTSSTTTTNDRNSDGAPPGDAHGGFFGRGPPGGHDGMRGGGLTVANGTANGRFVSFASDGSSIASVTVKDANATQALYARLSMSAPVENASNDHRGYSLRSASGDIIAIEDSPMAHVSAMSRNGTTVTIVIPDGATITAHDAVASWSPAGATISYANGQNANLVLSQNATFSVSGQTITVTLGPKDHADLGLVPSDFPYRGLEAKRGADADAPGEHGGPRGPGGPGHDGDMRGPPPGGDERGAGGPRGGRGPPR